jgi:hypothetical protein
MKILYQATSDSKALGFQVNHGLSYHSFRGGRFLVN